MGNSALYRLIAQVARGQGSASSQLDQVLKSTDSVFGNFDGIAGWNGDEGFKQEFRDDYLYGEQWGIERPASKQLGHFLTAVGMGYAQSEFRRLGSLYTIVGHEQRTDGRGRAGGLETIGRIGAQLTTPSDLGVFSFGIAVEQDAAGQYDERDFTLGTILDPTKHGDLSGRVGNSMIVGPVLGFLFAALPGVIGGAVLALLYCTLQYSYTASKTIMMLVSAFCGGLLAFLVLAQADVTAYTYDDMRKLYILGGEVLIGAGVGVWHAWKINRWLTEYPAQLKSRTPKARWR